MRPNEDAASKLQKDGVELQICRDCGYSQNIGYQVRKLTLVINFENDFSLPFREFVNKTATRLIDTYDLHSTKVLEIASGAMTTNYGKHVK